jgi:hypothetical protein
MSTVYSYMCPEVFALLKDSRETGTRVVGLLNPMA